MTPFFESRGETVKITVLIENTALEPLKCEHGLSMLIEFQDERILLDAGTTDLFLENAERMNVSLEGIQTCVLSHGHYDHSGGFATYLEQNQEAVLYMMEQADEEYYSLKGELHQIGIPKTVIESHRKRIKFINKITKLREQVYLVPHHTKGLDAIGARAGLYRKDGNELVPDDFRHELSLVFDTSQGLIVFNSCSHAGVKNIIPEVQNAFPSKKIYAFLGGLHMKGDVFTEEEIRGVADYLKAEGVQYLFTGHCTGEKAFAILKDQAGDMVQELTTGKIIDIF